MTKGKISQIDSLYYIYEEFDRLRKESDLRLEKLIAEEQLKAGQFEENEFGPVCP